MILAIRTDKPETELYLLDAKGNETDQEIWISGNQLSRQLLERIQNLLQRNKYAFENLTGLITFQGPGSFTGLRIGLTVANTIAYSQNIPIVGSTGDAWVEEGLKLLKSAKTGVYVMPEYGGEAHVTKPRK